MGLPDTAVKESRERVRSAVKNCGFEFPSKHITINLAPADQRKEGPIYDLPLLMSLLAAYTQGMAYRSLPDGRTVVQPAPFVAVQAG